MPHLIVTTRDGAVHTVEGMADRSVMEVMRDGGIDALLALCGGCCSCATCHVHVAADWLDRLPPIGDEEDDLLDATSSRDARSRLACQIRFTAALDGLPVTIADED